MKYKSTLLACIAGTLSTAAWGQSFPDIANQTLARTGVSPDMLANVLRPSPNSADFKALVNLGERGRIVTRLKLSLDETARETTRTMGHGGVTTLATGALVADPGTPGATTAPLGMSLIKGKFCRMLAGDMPCRQRLGVPPGTDAKPYASTPDQLDRVAGAQRGPGKSHLFRATDDGLANPAGYTFLGQMVDHDLTNTLTALANPAVRLIRLGRMSAQGTAVAQSQTIRLLGKDFTLKEVSDAIPPDASGSSVFLDLNNVYGVGSFAELQGALNADSKSLPWFARVNGNVATGHFNLRTISNHSLGLTGYDVLRQDDPQPDQPTSATPFRTALIQDGRNDENRMLAGVQSLFMRMHNACMNDRGGKTPAVGYATVFDECMADVRQIFQTIVVTDFLPRIMDTPTLSSISGVGDASQRNMVLPIATTAMPHPITLELYGAGQDEAGKPETKMPFEFSVAAFRVGHTLLRNDYRLNSGYHKQLFTPMHDQPTRSDLAGSRDLTPSEVIDWSYFFEIPGARHQPQPANGVDTHIALPVADLPISALPKGPKPGTPADAYNPPLETDTPDERNLPRRNVLRAEAGDATHGGAGIVTGEAAHAIVSAINKDHSPEVACSKIALIAPPIHGKCATPLWLYILAEAQVYGQSKHLGPLGSRIVGETILGILDADPNSAVHTLESGTSVWGPMADIRKHKRYTMPQMIMFLKKSSGDPLFN